MLGAGTKGSAKADVKPAPAPEPKADAKAPPAAVAANASPPPAADATPSAPPAAAKGEGFAVQLAAFTDDKGANALAAKLKKAGYATAYTEPADNEPRHALARTRRRIHDAPGRRGGAREVEGRRLQRHWWSPRNSVGRR